VCCGASPLGIGSDIGGSLRIPSAFCGIVCFKATPARVTRQGNEVCRLAIPLVPESSVCHRINTTRTTRNRRRTERSHTYSQSSGQCTHNELTLFRCIRSRLRSFRAFVVGRCRFVDDVPPFFEHGWWTQRCFDADPIAAPLVRINTFCLKCKCGLMLMLSRSIERCTTARTN
jgi:hypothetical protein